MASSTWEETVTANENPTRKRALHRWVHRHASPARVHVEIETGSSVGISAIAADLRAAGWSVDEQKTSWWRRSRGRGVLHAVGPPMFGEEGQIVEAVRSDMDFILGDIDARVLGIRVLVSSPGEGAEWVVATSETASERERRTIERHVSGLHLYGSRDEVGARVNGSLAKVGIRGNSWSLRAAENPLAIFAMPSNRRAFISVAIALTAGIVSGGAFPQFFGYHFAPNRGDLGITLVAIAILLVAGAAGWLLSIGKPSRARVRFALGAILMMMALSLAVCAAFITTSTAWWVAPIAVAVILVLAILQVLCGSLVMGWVRATRLRIPFGLVLTVVGVTALIAAFRTPMAMYYIGAGAPELIGTESWGVSVLAGGVFVLMVAIALAAAMFAVAGWRQRASQWVPRVVIPTFAAFVLAVTAGSGLAAMYSSGAQLAHGDYTLGSSVGLYPVCVLEPTSSREHGEYWLVGTDGRTSVLFDRSRDVARAEGREPRPVRPPIYVDIDKALRHVRSSEHCAP